MKKKRKGLKLRNKLILIYVPFLVLSVLFLGTFLTEQFRSSTMEQSVSICRQSTDLIQNNLLHQLDQYYQIGYDIANDNSLQQYLTLTEGGDYYLYSYYSERILGQISKAYYRNGDMQLHIYTENSSLQFAGIFLRDKVQFEAKKALVAPNPEAVYWEPPDSATGYIGFLLPVTHIDSYTVGVNIVGVLELRIRLNDLKQYLPDLKAEQNIVLLTDSAGENVVSNTAEDDELNSLVRENSSAGTAYVNYRGNSYLLLNNSLTNSRLNLSRWELTTLVPMDTVNRRISSLQRAGIYACLLCLLVMVPLIVLFSRTITKRLEYLVGKMDEISQGNYDVSVAVGGSDEITHLGEKFNEMLRTLNLLTKEEMDAKLKEEQLENARKEARIFALERQINPHYLFNTLESIRMSLVLKGDKQTADLVQTFAQSYREMIDGTEQSIALRGEMTFIRDYFTIQDFRHAGKIRLRADVPEELLCYRIPKFLLQPLIENAIFHGLEPKEEGGEVTLVARRAYGSLTFLVRDDGIGMDAGELASLRESLYSETPSRKNYALRNIAERLSLLYGDRSALTVSSAPGVGTSIFVKLPIDRLEVEKE